MKVTVVAQNTRGGHIEGVVFIHSIGVICHQRNVVDTVHRDGHRGNIGVCCIVIGMVSEGVCAVEVEIRCIGKASIGIEDQGTVAHIGVEKSLKGVVLNI